MTVMLAKKYSGETPVGYWMSEKLDGVRAVWDGEKFVSRNGNIFSAPDSFLVGMPKNIILDGELWGGRGNFQSTVGVVRRTINQTDWDDIQFMVFDIVNDDVFEKRMEQLKTINLPGHCQIIDHVLCESKNHMKKFEKEVVNVGGEGIMLRKANSKYVHKRTSELLKVKRFRTAEAKIIGFEDGNGKYDGCLGALICKFNNNIFKIGAGIPDIIRKYPPMVGEFVTFTFFELTTGGVPRFPSFVAVRNYE